MSDINPILLRKRLLEAEFSQVKSSIENTLCNMIDQQVVEDGITHPAEHYIEDAMQIDSRLHGACITTIICENVSDYTADILRLVSRCNDVSLDKQRIFRHSIQSDRVDIRDAAIGLMKERHWIEYIDFQLVKKQIEVESVDWLKKYMQEVMHETEVEITKQRIKSAIDDIKDAKKYAINYEEEVMYWECEKARLEQKLKDLQGVK